MGALTLGLALSSIVTMFANVRAYEVTRTVSEQQDRVTWENQGDRNPHSVAHFATWAFRPQTALSVLDPGLTPYAGAAIWMEAHHQNGARARPIDDKPTVLNLGHFSVAWVLQTIVPLLLFIVAAGLISRERERGTLRLLLVAGADGSVLLRNKLNGLIKVIAVIALPILASGILAALFAGAIDPLRLCLWIAVNGVFLGIIVVIGTAVSALSRTVSQATMALIGLWSAAILLTPRAGVALAEFVAPTPSPEVFWGDMSDELSDLPNPFEDDSFERTILEKYGVETTEDLPVSFAGLQLIESERIDAVVFDRSFGELTEIYLRQRVLMRLMSLLSPLPALQHVSSALAGTDIYHQLAFQSQAEVHRRDVVGALNQDMVDNAVGQDWDYVADESLWRASDTFHFHAPSHLDTLRTIWLDLLILGLWSIGALVLFRFASTSFVRSIV